MAKEKLYHVTLRPPESAPQEFEDREGRVRPLLRFVTLTAPSEQKAREAALMQALAVAREGEAAYEVVSVEEG